MTALLGLAGAIVAGVGLAAALVAIEQRRLAAPDAAEWLSGDMTVLANDVHAGLPAGSLVLRVFGPLFERFGAWAVGMLPSARLDRLHEQLLHAGLGATIRAEDVLAVNILTAVGSAAAAIIWWIVAAPPAGLAIAGFTVLVLIGVCVPRVWLTRRVAERKESIFKDLPDALDLMVIGMEAGVTFDGALQVVAEHLDSPLGNELGRTLAEMELGLSRRDALQNLRRRTDVPELTNMIVSLLQADALGMSVAKVLRVQAGEMRAKRRQWAREKAGKLPVKILFPLIVFIFPPVFVVIIGPAAPDIAGMFG